MSTRREFLKAIAVGAAALGTGNVALAQPEEAERKDRPNVVLIISDDQGFTDYGFMGHDTIRTPRLDQLATESVVFTRACVPSALCSPSLGTLLTGLYPPLHGLSPQSNRLVSNYKPYHLSPAAMAVQTEAVRPAISVVAARRR